MDKSPPINEKIIQKVSSHFRQKKLEIEKHIKNRGEIRVRHHQLKKELFHLSKPLKIAHLTDLHVGKVTSMKIQLKAVQLTNAEEPDLVFITGDFVCRSQLYLDDLSFIMRSFQAPVYVVLGNHDHWAGAQSVKTALKQGHAQVLTNQHSLIELGGEKIQIVGLDDAYTKNSDISRATAGLQKNLPTFGLSHIAEEADELWQRDVSLVVSGHTHGGQITVAKINEWLLKKVAGHKYIHGIYRPKEVSEGPKMVYVGAGIGSSVMPFRLGEQGLREVSIFEFV